MQNPFFFFGDKTINMQNLSSTRNNVLQTVAVSISTKRPFMLCIMCRAIFKGKNEFVFLNCRSCNSYFFNWIVRIQLQFYFLAALEISNWIDGQNLSINLHSLKKCREPLECDGTQESSTKEMHNQSLEKVIRGPMTRA